MPRVWGAKRRELHFLVKVLRVTFLDIVFV
jgi:hypothetical protein